MPLEEKNQDAIDEAIFKAVQNKDALTAYHQSRFMPFDPVGKRTEATVKDNQGEGFKVSKGAPQVIFQMCDLDSETEMRAVKAVEDFASRGYRMLGVARTSGNGAWKLLGMINCSGTFFYNLRSHFPR